MKTLQEITQELASAGLRMSPRSVRRKLSQLGIGPLSTGFRPAYWPMHSTLAIRTLAEGEAAARNPAGLPTLRQLRAVSPRARTNGSRRTLRRERSPHHD